MEIFDRVYPLLKYDDSTPTPYLSNRCKRCGRSYPLMFDPDVNPASPDFPVHEHLTRTMCKDCRNDKLLELKWLHENHPFPNILSIMDKRMLQHLVGGHEMVHGRSSTKEELAHLNTDCPTARVRFRNEDRPMQYKDPIPPCICGGCPPLRWYERAEGVPEGME